jgi:hypothetical protein
MGLFMLLVFFVLVVGGVVILARIMTRAHERARREVASQTGLVFEPKKSIGGSWSLSGQIDDHPVVVKTVSSGENSTSTVYRVGFPETLGFQLNVQRTGLFQQVIKIFGAEDIELGDAEFDAKYVVKGWTHEQVRAFLTPARRLRCARFLSAKGERRLSETGLEVTRPGSASDVSEMVNEIQRLVTQARNFWAPPADEKHLNAALDARGKGELDTALTEVRAVSEGENSCFWA